MTAVTVPIPPSTITVPGQTVNVPATTVTGPPQAVTVPASTVTVDDADLAALLVGKGWTCTAPGGTPPPIPPTKVQVGPVGVSTGTALALTLRAPAAAGNRLIAVLFDYNAEVAAPTGWQPDGFSGAHNGITFLSHIATGGEQAASFTVSGAGMRGCLLEVAGAPGVIAVSAGNHDSSAPTCTLPLPLAARKAGVAVLGLGVGGSGATALKVPNWPAPDVDLLASGGNLGVIAQALTGPASLQPSATWAGPHSSDMVVVVYG